MEPILALITGIASLATTTGFLLQMHESARAHSRAERAKAAMDNSPANLRAHFEEIHREASLHLLSVTLSSSSYSRPSAYWSTAAVFLNGGVAVSAAFSVANNPMISGQDLNFMQLMPSSSGPAEIIFGGFNMAAITFSTYAFASEASRRRLYADIYDDLNESGYPDIKALRESYNKLWRRETLPPALFLSGGVVTTASFTGINFGILIGGANISRSAFITLGAVTLISITWTLLHAHFLFHPHTRSSLVTFTERSQLASNQTKHSGK